MVWPQNPYLDSGSRTRNGSKCMSLFFIFVQLYMTGAEAVLAFEYIYEVFQDAGPAEFLLSRVVRDASCGNKEADLRKQAMRSFMKKQVQESSPAKRSFSKLDLDID